MDQSIGVWLFGVSIFGAAVGLACYMVRKGKPRGPLFQGVVGVSAGILLLISLFFPWVEMVEYGAQISGLEIGDLFAFLIKMQLMKVITMFLLLFAFLTVLGSFLLMIGYELGTQIVAGASSLALFMSIVAVLALGTIPSEEIYLSIHMTPVIYIFGAILGITSTKLERISKT